MSPNIRVTQACNVNFRNACPGVGGLSKYFSDVFQTAEGSMATLSAAFSDPSVPTLALQKEVLAHSNRRHSRSCSSEGRAKVGTRFSKLK